MTFPSFVECSAALRDVRASANGPAGTLPLTEDLFRHAPSGDLFGWSQNAGMGWRPDELNRREFIILSTSGGLRNDDGTPVALGYHSGHWEVGLADPKGHYLQAGVAVIYRADGKRLIAVRYGVRGQVETTTPAARKKMEHLFKVPYRAVWEDR